MEAVKSSKRTLEILELLTASEAGLTFTQISEVLALPRSSLHGLLTTLVDASWLAYDDPGKTYRLGIRTLESGNAYLRSQDLPNRARAHMERIRDTIDETVQLSVLDGRFNVYVSKVDGNQALSLASAVGRRLPAHATGVGKVLLAGLPDSSLDALFRSVRMERFTDQTVPDLPSLRKRLARIRRLGYGTDEEEYTIGVRCVAVPIRDQHGVIAAAMSVSAPAVRFDKKRSQQALDLLVDAAAQLSSALGYGNPATRPA